MEEKWISDYSGEEEKKHNEINGSTQIYLVTVVSDTL